MGLNGRLANDLAGVGGAVGEAGGALVQLHLVRRICGYGDTRMRDCEDMGI